MDNFISSRALVNKIDRVIVSCRTRNVQSSVKLNSAKCNTTNDFHYKVQVGKDQEKAPTPKTEVGKTKLTIRHLYHENIS